MMVSFLKFNYFQKCAYVFITCGIITEMRDLFFLADDGVLHAQANSKRDRQLGSFGKDSVDVKHE